MTEATAWAVLASGGRIICVNSVAETRRAAIINWLVTEKHCDIRNSHTDDDVERMWKHHGQYVDCRHVTITPRSDREKAQT